MTKQLLIDLINDVNHENLVRFFRDRNSTFRPTRESLSETYDDELFTNSVKLGEIPFGMVDQLIVCAFNVARQLTERSGKKAQYELAKKIIRDRDADAGIFVFIGENGNFRFSLVYASYLGTKVDYSNFRRFTYFVSPELTNKTFIQRVGEGDFSSLESIKEAFSVEKVTKEFYQKISYWYFWACQQCQFPEHAEEEENGRQVAVIRLITRLIFIWFMREMKLVPNHLFDEDFVNKALKNVDPDNSTYYLAILQNLFFATLNTKPEDRTFRSPVRGPKGYNPDFGNQYKFRYQDLFANPDALEEYFGDIPFLNGGLFDCLDDKEHRRYVDGFTETKKHQPQVPNGLFFSPEKNVDINAELGTTNRTYRVEGLINILSTYNFTIDENTLDDQDVALDPELLGKVFENLLASFNPETSTTARKATGSYYTPREIVDYMVEEALKGYFQTHLDNVEDLEEKLNDLFAQNAEGHRFTDEEARQIVELVENVRIVDPAVGSGAFPMGALNKLVFILSKLDKDNALWKKAQLDAANAISDPSIRKQVKASIETYFREKDANYGRKLYLIQKCIYGVDIQQIAVEIAKLRFFIALLVDEKVDKNKDNWGIEPLPNLDFKIMQGNSLISEYLGIKFSIGAKAQQANETLPLFEDENKRLIEQFDQKKIAYQTASNPDKKKVLQGEIEDLLVNIFKDLVKKQKVEYFQRLEAIERKYAKVPDKETRESAIDEEKQKFAKHTGLDVVLVEEQIRQFTTRQRVKSFFPWELYFSEVFLEKGGFDIIIANPPYVGEKGHKELFREVRNANLGSNYMAKMDYFYFFIHLAIDLGTRNAQIVFITTNYFLTATGAKVLRNNIKIKCSIKKLINFNELTIFESAQGQHNIIMLLEKGYKEDTSVNTLITNRNGVATTEIFEKIFSCTDKKTEYYHVDTQSGIYDGEKNYIRLTNYNQTNISLSKAQNPINIILNKIANYQKLGSICNINTGCDITISKITGRHLRKFDGSFSKGEGVFVLSPHEVKKLELNEKESTLVKDFVKNSDIYKYCITLNQDKLLYIQWDDDIDKFPSIKKHLLKYKTILIDQVNRYGEQYPWYALHRTRDQRIFLSDEKILVPYRSRLNIFGYFTEEVYSSRDVLFITNNRPNDTSLKYILALLNSKLYFLWLYYRGKRKGNILELVGMPLSEIPIKLIPKKSQKPFIDIVDDILSLTFSEGYLQNTSKQEQVRNLKLEIDQMVYELYEFSEEEINVVETFKITS